MNNLFQVTTEFTGSDWLIADLGEATDGTHYYLTTARVPASALPALGSVEEQAETICRLLNEYHAARRIGDMANFVIARIHSIFTDIAEMVNQNEIALSEADAAALSAAERHLMSAWLDFVKQE